MDNATLENLKTAFRAAPSAELAKVIILQAIQEAAQQTGQGISEYIDHVTGVLSVDEAFAVTDFLINDGCAAHAIPLLDPHDPAQSAKLVEVYANADRMDDAKALYATLLDTHPQHRSAALDTLLGIESAQTSERPKLRVVDKPASADVADLSRYREKPTDFSDVVGLTQIKKQIHKKIILPFHKPSLFQRFKKKVGGGVLLYGPPGCGKTLLARATAGECNASFYNIEISDVLDMYIGESENNLHAIFEKARSDTPCVLFFDELEALAAKREHNRGNASNIVSQFLTELDGFSQNNDGVLVLASTNVPWSIDSAFLRPGRFDRMFFVPPPDQEARQAIVAHYLKDKPTDAEIDAGWVAKRTGGFSGADLENLIEMAADEAIDEMIETEVDVNISFAHVKDALAQARATTLEWLTTARNYARYANDGGRYDEVLEFLKKNGK